jgi:hypothetical protein
VVTGRTVVPFTVRLLFIISTIVVGLAPEARADVTYEYTGQPFANFDGSYACPSRCHITASFTVAQALPANLPWGSITPQSFTFTDGYLKVSGGALGLHSYLEIATDANGNINIWDFNLGSPDPTSIRWLETINELSIPIANFANYLSCAGSCPFFFGDGGD